jgi:diguanylate cyclase (GGDEF)-like protein
MMGRAARRGSRSFSIRLTYPPRLGPRLGFHLGRPARRSRDWELWTLRPAVLTYVLAVQVLALGSTIMLLTRQSIRPDDLAMLSGLTALGVVKEEMTRRVEQARRRYSDTPHQNMTSVWTFAAALVLPAGLVAVLVAILYAHLWFRTWHTVRNVRPWKLIFSASAVTLSCHTATAIQQVTGPSSLAEPDAWQTAALLTLAIVAYSAVNLGLVSGAIALLTTERAARTPRRLFGTLGDILLEYATLAMGAIAAIILIRSPWAVILLLPVLLVLHRSVLVRELEDAASTDAKTGLLNATAWKALATSEYQRCVRDGTEWGILMLDLDHFKRINDTHGHRAGDQVLRAVADQLAAQMREYDLLGRYGGEEFVAFCSELTAHDLTELGERLRHAVEQLEVSVTDTDAGDPNAACGRIVRPTISVGAAHYPDSGADLEEVQLAADTALFAAKDAGRNTVEVLRPRLHQHTPHVDELDDYSSGSSSSA